MTSDIASRAQSKPNEYVGLELCDARLFRVTVTAKASAHSMATAAVWIGTNYEEAILRAERYSRATGLPVVDSAL